MVRLVALLQAAQDRDRVCDRRLADEDRLEAALERGVLLDVLAVLVERRCADGSQLAAREHRLQEVACADGAFGCPCADDGVQLVDEEDDLALGRLDLVEDGLQPFLELASVFGAGEQRTDVERPDALPLEAFRDVAGDDALREPLDDRGLAHAGVADQDGVVLRAAREHLDHAPYFLVAADHRVELAVLGCGSQVAAELLERLVGLLRILRRHALPAAHRLDLRLELVAGNDVEREQQVLGRDVVVLHPFRLVRRGVEHTRERGGDVRLLLHPLNGRLGAQRSLGLRAQLGGVGHELLRQLLVEQRQQQMLGVELGVAKAARKLLRRSDRLLALDRQLVEVHVTCGRFVTFPSRCPTPGRGSWEQVRVRGEPASHHDRVSCGASPTAGVRHRDVAISDASGSGRWAASTARGRGGTGDARG